MKTQIKKWGDSKVLVLSSDFLKFNNAKVGDWIDLSDCFIVSEKLQELKDEKRN